MKSLRFVTEKSSSVAVMPGFLSSRSFDCYRKIFTNNGCPKWGKTSDLRFRKPFWLSVFQRLTPECCKCVASISAPRNFDCVPQNRRLLRTIEIIEVRYRKKLVGLGTTCILKLRSSDCCRKIIRSFSRLNGASTMIVGGTLIQRSQNRRKSDRIRVAKTPDRILCTTCVYHLF